MDILRPDGYEEMRTAVGKDGASIFFEGDLVVPEIATISEALKNHRLGMLVFYCPPLVDKALTKYLMPALAEAEVYVLGFLSTSITEESCEAICINLIETPTPVALYFMDSNLGDSGIKMLGKTLQNPEFNITLTILELENNDIGDHGAKYIGRILKYNSTITQLELQNNRLTDTGAGLISKGLWSNSTLKTLMLQYNQIKDTGALALSAALDAENTKVTHLDVFGNLFSADGRAELNRHNEAALEQGLDIIVHGITLDPMHRPLGEIPSSEFRVVYGYNKCAEGISNALETVTFINDEEKASLIPYEVSERATNTEIGKLLKLNYMSRHAQGFVNANKFTLEAVEVELHVKTRARVC